MKITFAHMGTLSIVLEALFIALEQEVIAPPPYQKEP